jgi:hypothetical protein
MLRVLMELALASEVLREHINARIEALAVPIKARTTLAGPNGMLVEEAIGGPGRRSAIQPLSVGPADAENPEFWTKWLSSCKCVRCCCSGIGTCPLRAWSMLGRPGLHAHACTLPAHGWRDTDLHTGSWQREPRREGCREGPLALPPDFACHARHVPFTGWACASRLAQTSASAATGRLAAAQAHGGSSWSWTRAASGAGAWAKCVWGGGRGRECKRRSAQHPQHATALVHDD